MGVADLEYAPAPLLASNTGLAALVKPPGGRTPGAPAWPVRARLHARPRSGC